MRSPIVKRALARVALVVPLAAFAASCGGPEAKAPAPEAEKTSDALEYEDPELAILGGKPYNAANGPIAFRFVGYDEATHWTVVKTEQQNEPHVLLLLDKKGGILSHARSDGLEPAFRAAVDFRSSKEGTLGFDLEDPGFQTALTAYAKTLSAAAPLRATRHVATTSHGSVTVFSGGDLLFAAGHGDRARRLSEGVAYDPVVSPDGSRVAFNGCDRPCGGTYTLRIARLKGSEPAKSFPEARFVGVADPHWSLDGSSVFSLSTAPQFQIAAPKKRKKGEKRLPAEPGGQSCLLRADERSGEVKKLYCTQSISFPHLAFSPDGRMAAFWGPTQVGALRVEWIDLVSGAIKGTHTLSAVLPGSAALSDVGLFAVVYGDGHGGSNVHVIDLKSGGEIGKGGAVEDVTWQGDRTIATIVNEGIAAPKLYRNEIP